MGKLWRKISPIWSGYRQFTAVRTLLQGFGWWQVIGSASLATFAAVFSWIEHQPWSILFVVFLASFASLLVISALIDFWRRRPTQFKGQIDSVLLVPYLGGYSELAFSSHDILIRATVLLSNALRDWTLQIISNGIGQPARGPFPIPANYILYSEAPTTTTFLSSRGKVAERPTSELAGLASKSRPHPEYVFGWIRFSFDIELGAKDVLESSDTVVILSVVDIDGKSFKTEPKAIAPNGWGLIDTRDTGSDSELASPL